MGQYEYSGKPSGDMRVPAGDYVRIDADVPDPRTGATEFQNLYANCEPEWKPGGTQGWVQVKYVRENGDATGYQTYAVNATMPALLITATHWERGEAGQGGRWHIKCGGDLAAIKVGTRYVKLAVVT
jgi:hypothetical protein